MSQRASRCRKPEGDLSPLRQKVLKVDGSGKAGRRKSRVFFFLKIAAIVMPSARKNGT
jgi:hypothetical protein